LYNSPQLENISVESLDKLLINPNVRADLDLYKNLELLRDNLPLIAYK
jgi:hypothetical protein